VKSLKHSDYLENIVQALMRKGMDKGKATAIARGSIRKWMAKSRHPEVRAAAGLAETQEIAAQARAHAHAVSWDDIGGVIGLAANPGQPRAANGKFGSGGTPAAPAGKAKTAAPLTSQQQQAGQQQSAKASATAKATAAATIARDRQAKKVQGALTQSAKPPKPDPHQQHVAHVQELQKQAALRMQEKSEAKETTGDKGEGGQTRAGLLGTAKADLKKADALKAQRKVLQGELASAGGATSSGQSGGTTSAGASTTASTTPAVAATPAAATPAATTPSTTAASSSTSSTPTAAQLTTAIAGLTSQITSLLKSAAAAQAQAAKMGSAPPAKAPAK
jgi:trimeric autotransporter adhesin